MEIKSKIKEYFPYIITTLAIILPFFFHPGYLFFTDMVRGPQVNLDWTSSHFLINLTTKIFSFVFSLAFLEKLYIGIAIFVILLGAKKLVGCFLGDKFAIFVISLFAVFNPFVYDRMMYGQVGINISLGLLMFATANLLLYLESKERQQIIYFGICAGVALWFSPHFVFFFGIILALFLFLYYKKWGWDEWKNFLKYLFFVFGICLMLNINPILGDLLGKTSKVNFVNSLITEEDLSAFRTSGDTDSGVFKNVFMMSGFWGKDQGRYVDLTTLGRVWGRSFFFLVLVLLIGFAVGVSKKETRNLSFGLLAILGVSIVLASGVGISYFENITIWLFEHMPFYKGLRETQKWVAVVIICYTVFLSMGTKALFETEIFSKYKKILLSLFGVVVVMQAPLLLWGFFGQARPIDYPPDWSVVDKEMICEKGEKILFLPWHLYMKFNWVGKIVGNPASQFFTCPVISSTAMEWGGIYDNSGDTDSKMVEEWINKNGADDLLKDNKLGIKYIILAKEVDWRNYLWIDEIGNLEIIKETNTLKVYKIK